MEKVQLSNGEQIEIQDGATENSVKVEVESQEAFLELYNKFTDDNLSQVSFLNEADVLCTIYKNKTLYKAELETVIGEETEKSKLIATFNLKDVDTTKIKLKELQETVDTLVLNTLGIDVSSETEETEETAADDSLDKDLEIEEQRDDDDANEFEQEEGEENETDVDETVQE